jgi:DNA-binding IclR family transcriptional regulator
MAQAAELRKAAKTPPTPTLTHRSLKRGLSLLEILGGSGGPLGLADIARRSGLHRSTAHHLLQTLVGLGYLRQDGATRCYELAAKLFQLTEQIWTPEQLGVLARPFVSELAKISGEGASCAAYHDGVVRIVAKFEQEHPMRVVDNAVSARPIHAAAVARAIVAFLPKRDLGALLDTVRFDRFTPNTIVKRRALEAELERIRTSGVAFDDEEHIEGIRCIAAPVRIYNGQVIASLCAVGPKSRMTKQRLRELKAPILELAADLSARLGSRVKDRRPPKLA